MSPWAHHLLSVRAARAHVSRMPDKPPRTGKPTVIRAWRDAAERAGDGPMLSRGRGNTPRRGRAFKIAFWLLLLLVLFLARTVATRYTDLLWYREIGFERVFVLKIVA